MSAQTLKHLCTCEGKGWIHENDDWDLCMAGCLPPTKQDNEPQGTLAMLKAYNRDFGKAVT